MGTGVRVYDGFAREALEYGIGRKGEETGWAPGCGFHVICSWVREVTNQGVGGECHWGPPSQGSWGVCLCVRNVCNPSTGLAREAPPFEMEV